MKFKGTRLVTVALVVHHCTLRDWNTCPFWNFTHIHFKVIITGSAPILNCSTSCIDLTLKKSWQWKGLVAIDEENLSGRWINNKWSIRFHWWADSHVSGIRIKNRGDLIIGQSCLVNAEFVQEEIGLIGEMWMRRVKTIPKLPFFCQISLHILSIRVVEPFLVDDNFRNPHLWKVSDLTGIISVANCERGVRSNSNGAIVIVHVFNKFTVEMNLSATGSKAQGSNIGGMKIGASENQFVVTSCTDDFKPGVVPITLGKKPAFIVSSFSNKYSPIRIFPGVQGEENSHFTPAIEISFTPFYEEPVCTVELYGGHAIEICFVKPRPSPINVAMILR